MHLKSNVPMATVAGFSYLIECTARQPFYLYWYIGECLRQIICGERVDAGFIGHIETDLYLNAYLRAG